MISEYQDQDYQGDGNPSCPSCLGRGVVPVDPALVPAWVIMPVQPCVCVKERDVNYRLDRGWPGLGSQLPTFSPLRGRAKESLWITATLPVLKAHCADAMREQVVKFRLATDNDLVTTWLTNVEEVYDGDTAMARMTDSGNTYSRLVDLIGPPDLLILRVGIKAARNSAAPEVLLETLQHREAQEKPTWLVDLPSYPLQPGHISFDARVHDYLEDWPRIDLGSQQPSAIPVGKGIQEMSLEAPTSVRKPSTVKVSSTVPSSYTMPSDLTFSDDDLFGSSKDKYKKSGRKGGFNR